MDSLVKIAYLEYCLKPFKMAYLLSAKYCRTYVYVKLGITNWKSPKSCSRIFILFILVNVPFSLYSCKTLFAVTYVSIRFIEIQKAFMFVINSKENILVSSNGIFHRNTAQEQYKLEREMGEGRT